jgi:hypothetical protein
MNQPERHRRGDPGRAKGGLEAVTLIFIIDQLDQGTYLGTSVIDLDQPFVAVVYGKIWNVLGAIMARKKELIIPAHHNILVIAQVIVLVEVSHFVKGQCREHDEPHFFQGVHVLEKLFCHVLAVFAIRAEVHEDDGLAGWKVAGIKYGGTILLQNVECRKALIRQVWQLGILGLGLLLGFPGNGDHKSGPKGQQV